MIHDTNYMARIWWRQTMITAEQITDEVARIADEAYYDAGGNNTTMSFEDIMKHAIAAAINAWPGAALSQRIHPTIGPRRITLPLPQKEGDA